MAPKIAFPHKVVCLFSQVYCTNNGIGEYLGDHTAKLLFRMLHIMGIMALGSISRVALLLLMLLMLQVLLLLLLMIMLQLLLMLVGFVAVGVVAAEIVDRSSCY